MSIFGRMKRAVKSKANAAIDKAIDPAKEIEMAILELETQQKSALRDLLSYKATAKVMEKDIAALEEKVPLWEKRAMAAVRKGDDALARECLREQKTSAAELERLRRDRDEANGYAVELNRSRKQIETKLQMLKLKKGTMATQIAAARSGTGNAFGFSDSPFDRMNVAEEKIESDAIAAEVASELDDEGGSRSGTSEAAFDAALIAAGADPAEAAGDDALSQLKAKMAAEKSQKQLKKGS
ncbi:MAG TPA: PspA/IM30 family protein [Kofleriaceae bacterium]|nr:PspA/IM30 family protein [Kofleriaceae bacterium]